MNKRKKNIVNSNSISISLMIILIFTSSCISLREEYPEIHYYRLTQTEENLQNIGAGTIEGTLQIRNFSVSDAIDTDHFLGISDDNTVQVYYYHRWIASASDLVTDFIVTRYNDLRVFTGGVVKPASILVPDYILEGQLIDMVAHNTNDNKSPNYVYIALRISLIKKVSLSTDKKILINKVFTVKSPRKNNSVETIAPAFSMAVSQISDQMLFEIQNAISKDRE
jgi:ABC-type uncharacterized transport system auxiliary subunit